MKHPVDYKETFRQHRCCVLIPTYNNASTLEKVLLSVLEYCDDVIVVNDGSTDRTAEILAGISGIQVISYPKNRGKGYALRKGFVYASQKGYRHAITMDSDGQHAASDLPLFLNKLETSSAEMIIGARNMTITANVPGKSSFGHRFSNFWFKVETGIDAPDTQSGYRLYPLYAMKNMRFFSVRYEFEIEVLVRLAWRGVHFDFVPITVYYPPKEQRITHFRPFADFARISLLNTVLVLIAFLYIRPRNLYRSLTEKKTFVHSSGCSFLTKTKLFSARHYRWGLAYL